MRDWTIHKVEGETVFVKESDEYIWRITKTNAKEHKKNIRKEDYTSEEDYNDTITLFDEIINA